MLVVILKTAVFCKEMLDLMSLNTNIRKLKPWEWNYENKDIAHNRNRVLIHKKHQNVIHTVTRSNIGQTAISTHSLSVCWLLLLIFSQMPYRVGFVNNDRIQYNDSRQLPFGRLQFECISLQFVEWERNLILCSSNLFVLQNGRVIVYCHHSLFPFIGSEILKCQHLLPFRVLISRHFSCR